MKLIFSAGGRHFEVRREHSQRYAGYVNGTKAVSAVSDAAVIRLLIEKHIRLVPKEKRE